MSNKNPKHPRHDRRRRNASASTRARAPIREHGHDAAWRAVKTAAGAAGAALACAFIARKEWLPPKLITGVVSVVGAVFAVGGRSDTLRAVGAGAMSAAGTQLGLMLLDDRHRSGRLAVPTKPSNVDRLPSDALASAFARERERLKWAPLGAAPLGDRRNAAESPPGAMSEAMQSVRTAEGDVFPFAAAASDRVAVAEVAHDSPATHATVTHDLGARDDTQALQSSLGPPSGPSGPRDPCTSSPPSTPDLASKPHHVDDLVASICIAVAPGASAETRGTGAAACRAILSSLETQVGPPLAAAPLAAAPLAVTSPTSPLSGMLSHLASMPREQLIELLINRLREALPLSAPTRLAAGPRYHTIPIPQVHPQVSG